MDWKRIESRTNPAVKYAVSLADKKVRDREGLFFAEGVTLFFDFCQSGIFPRRLYLSDEASSLTPEIEKVLAGKDTELYSLSKSAFEKITTEKGAQGLFSVYASCHLPALSADASRFVALERVQDPGNVGTVIRTAAAFGFDGVLLVSCADPCGPKTVRATMGALGRIPVKSFPDAAALFAFLKKEGVRCVATCLSEQAKPIGQTDLSGKVCILIGNEGKGLSEEAIACSDAASTIPIENMESLNAASAATIFLWEVKRRADLEG